MDISSNFRTEQLFDTKRYLKYIGIVAASVTFFYPIELVKSRIQTSPQLLLKGSITQPYCKVFDTFRRVAKQQQVKGLWKGASYFVMRTLPSNIGVFTIKQFIHRRFTRFLKQSNPSSKIIQQLSKHYVIVNSLIGGGAGLAIQVMIYPFDYFRIILSNEVKNHPGDGIVKCIKEVIHNKGILGIFKGVSMNLFYIGSARAVYFGLYDSYKTITTDSRTKLILSYVSISVALLVNYPIDTIRKRMILAPKRYANGRQCLIQMWKNQKLNSFFSGWRTISIQSISFSTLFYLYDIIFTQIFNKREK